jgi:serine/threonine protein kinase
MQLCDGGLSVRIKDISKAKTLMRGTEGYMPPEVFKGDNIRHPFAVDLYCVGITLAQMRKVVSIILFFLVHII